MAGVSDLVTATPPTSSNATRACCNNTTTATSLAFFNTDSSIVWSRPLAQMTLTAGFLWLLVVVGLPFNVALLAAYSRTCKQYLVLPPSAIAVNLCINNVLLVLSATLAAAALTFDLGAAGAKAGGAQTFLGMHVLLQSWMAQVMVVFCSAWAHTRRNDRPPSYQDPKTSSAQQSSRVLVVCGSCVHRPNPRYNSKLALVRRDADGTATPVCASDTRLSTATSFEMSARQRRRVTWWLPWTWFFSLLSGSALLMSASKYASNLCLTLDPFRKQYVVSVEHTKKKYEDTASVPQRIPLLLILLPVYLVGVALIVWSVCRRHKAQKSGDKALDLQTESRLEAGESDRHRDVSISGKPTDHSHTAPRALSSEHGLIRGATPKNRGDQCVLHVQQSADEPSHEPSDIGDAGSPSGMNYNRDHARLADGFRLNPLSVRPRMRLMRSTRRFSLQRRRPKSSKEKEMRTQGRAVSETDETNDAETFPADTNKNANETNCETRRKKRMSHRTDRRDENCGDSLTAEGYFDARHIVDDNDDPENGYASMMKNAAAENFNISSNPSLDGRSRSTLYGPPAIFRKAEKTKHITFDTEIDYAIFDTDEYILLSDMQGEVVDEHIMSTPAIEDENRNARKKRHKIKARKSAKPNRRSSKRRQRDYYEIIELSTEGISSNIVVGCNVPAVSNQNINFRQSKDEGKQQEDAKSSRKTRQQARRGKEGGEHLVDSEQPSSRSKKDKKATTQSKPVPGGHDSNYSKKESLHEPDTSVFHPPEDKYADEYCDEAVDRSTPECDGSICSWKSSRNGVDHCISQLQQHDNVDEVCIEAQGMSTPECDDSSCPQKGGLDWADPGIAQLPEDEDADEVSDESADKADVNVNTNASSKGRTKSTRRLQGGGEVPDNQADGPDDDVTSQAEMDTQSLSSSGDSSSVNSRYAKTHEGPASGPLRLRLSQRTDCGPQQPHLPCCHPSHHSALSAGGRLRVGTAVRIVSSSMHHFTVQGPPPSAAHLLPPGWLCRAPHQQLPHPQTQLQHQQHLARLSAVRTPLSPRSGARGIGHAHTISSNARSFSALTDAADREDTDDREERATRIAGRETLLTSRPATSSKTGVGTDAQATDSIDELLGRLTYFQTHDVGGVSSEATVVDIPSLHSFEENVHDVDKRMASPVRVSAVGLAQEMYSKTASPSVPCAGDQLTMTPLGHPQNAKKWSERGAPVRGDPNKSVVGAKSLTLQQQARRGRDSADGDQDPTRSEGASAARKTQPTRVDSLSGCCRCSSFQTKMTRKLVCLSGLAVHVLTCVPFAIALLPGIWGLLDCESRLLGLTVVRLLMFTHVVVCPLWLLACHGRWLLRRG